MEMKIRDIKDGPFEIHDLAALVPMATEVEQIALTEDIKENGQRDAIVLWRGKVVDGRCRQKALVTLGRHIMYKELDDSLTEDEVAIFVKSVNTRRNLTITQKAMSAAKSKLEGRDKRANPIIAKSWTIGLELFKNAKYIWEHNKSMAQDLFDGKAVNIIDAKGNATTSSKVTAVYAYLRRLAEAVAEVEEETYGWDANSYIKTQAGKEWFYATIQSIKDKDIDVNMLIAELANYKFKGEIK